MYILCVYFFTFKKRKHYEQRYFKPSHVLSSHLSTIYLIVCLGYRVLPEINLTSVLRQREEKALWMMYYTLLPCCCYHFRQSRGRRGRELVLYSPTETLTGQPSSVGLCLALPIKGKTRSCTPVHTLRKGSQSTVPDWSRL